MAGSSPDQRLFDTRRIDRAHRLGDGDGAPAGDVKSSTANKARDAATPATTTTDRAGDPLSLLLGDGPHVHLQAEQLARLLADRLAEIDRREAQLNLLSADLDNQQRTARLALVERERELDQREAFLARLETTADNADRRRAHDRLERFLRADSPALHEPSDLAGALNTELLDTESLCFDEPIDFVETADEPTERALDDEAAQLDARQLRLDAIRDTLVSEHRRLFASRRTIEGWARRQRHELERRAAELAERERVVARQAAEIERWRVERVSCFEELQRLRRQQGQTARSA
ncbi:MAG: hypothetical protein KDA63_13540 [Planctomycetales bacterium]|nr:hypothetical protein [Planctomycetales bacterium]